MTGNAYLGMPVKLLRSATQSIGMLVCSSSQMRTGEGSCCAGPGLAGARRIRRQKRDIT